MRDRIIAGAALAAVVAETLEFLRQGTPPGVLLLPPDVLNMRPGLRDSRVAWCFIARGICSFVSRLPDTRTLQRREKRSGPSARLFSTLMPAFELEPLLAKQL